MAVLWGIRKLFNKTRRSNQLWFQVRSAVSAMIGIKWILSHRSCILGHHLWGDPRGRILSLSGSCGFCGLMYCEMASISHSPLGIDPRTLCMHAVLPPANGSCVQSNAQITHIPVAGNQSSVRRLVDSPAAGRGGLKFDNIAIVRLYPPPFEIETQWGVAQCSPHTGCGGVTVALARGACHPVMQTLYCKTIIPTWLVITAPYD